MSHFSRDFLRSQTTFAFRQRVRELFEEFRLLRRHRKSCRKARRLSSPNLLKLNLGCGAVTKSGWINVDMWCEQADLQLDLREQLPFENDSVSIVYSEHFFEHLEYPYEVMGFLTESQRVLIPGGILSIGIPDFEGAITAYVRRADPHGDKYKRPEWVKTPMDALNYAFRQGREHKYAYDFETLALVLSAAGFISPVIRPFDPELDSEYRKGSLYVQAKKPG